MQTYADLLSSAENKFTKLVKKPEKYLDPGPDLFDDIKLLSKVLYDIGKVTEEGDNKTLPELLIENYDEEQVWAGLQLQNTNRLAEWNKKLARLDLSGSYLLVGSKGEFDNSTTTTEARETEEQDLQAEEADPSDLELSDLADADDDDQDESEDEENEEFDEDILNDPDFQNMSDSDQDNLPLFDKLSEDEMSEVEEDSYEARERKNATSEKPTQVDDQFFKLRDMEKFLDSEDRKEERKLGNQDDDDEEDEVDFFDDVGEEEDVMYKQYFDDQPDTSDVLKSDNLDKENEEMEEEDEEEEGDEEEDEGVESDAEATTLEKDRSRRDLLTGSDESDVESGGAAVESSSHEKSQSRLKEKIKKLEERAVSDKPWQMGGEVAAPLRPENSLLAEDLDYESGVRQAPVITEDVARKLEDIIKQRVKDAAWDDVTRKVKPVEDPQEYRKKLVLDQEKSKLSLAQVYEQEYLRVSQAQEKVATPGLLDKVNEETPKEVEEIKVTMRSLFAKLDTLSHFHYTPKQKSAEVRIVKNVASISMEEVAPVASSNADLLAPEEVVDKQKGELMEDGDKTSTDKKRERRKKKAAKRAAIAEKERREKERMEAKGEDSRMSKGAVLKRLKQAEKEGSLRTIKDKHQSKTLKSSTSFFNVLQDEVQTQLQGKPAKKKKAGKSVSLAAIKL